MKREEAEKLTGCLDVECSWIDGDKCPIDWECCCSYKTIALENIKKEGVDGRGNEKKDRSHNRSSYERLG